MRKRVDMSGQQFGRLTAVEYSHYKRPKTYWRCRCECGNEAIVSQGALKSGNTRSCGCLARDVNVTHGSSKSPVYKVWQAMRDRCHNPNNAFYPDYGGRGISVCARWQGFAAFQKDMGHRPKGATIERKDVNGDYAPNNCCWASPRTQGNNRRNNRRISMDGVTHTVAEWSRLTGIDKSCILYRLNSGWSVRNALTIPPSRGRNSSATRRNLSAFK